MGYVQILVCFVRGSARACGTQSARPRTTTHLTNNERDRTMAVPNGQRTPNTPEPRRLGSTLPQSKHQDYHSLQRPGCILRRRRTTRDREGDLVPRRRVAVPVYRRRCLELTWERVWMRVRVRVGRVRGIERGGMAASMRAAGACLPRCTRQAGSDGSRSHWTDNGSDDGDGVCVCGDNETKDKRSDEQKKRIVNNQEATSRAR